MSVRTERRQWGWRVTRTVPSASHAYAKQTLQGLFVRLLRGVGRLIAAPAPIAGESDWLTSGS